MWKSIGTGLGCSPRASAWALGFLLALGLGAQSAAAQTVWSGLDFEFAKEDFADPDDPANQDSITEGVALTRGDAQGLYNAAQENSFFRPISPADTLWAFPTNNPGALVAADNFENLNFDVWANAVANDPPGVVDQPGVLFVVSEELYIDVEFTSWSIGRTGGGGGFSYLRALPEPSEALLILPALGALAYLSRARRRVAPLRI